MRIRAQKKVDLVLDYLSMGIELDGLDLKMSLDEFVSFIYPKESRLLKDHLSSFDILNYMREYDTFKLGLMAQFFKEGIYMLCLFLASYGLSWFFLTKFSVSVMSMIESFEIDVSIIFVYQSFVQIFLFFTHCFVLIMILLFWLFRSLDLRTLFYLIVYQRISFVREYVTYRFALLMSLFLKYGVKTQAMIHVLRESGLDTFSRWLAYHVETDLNSGKNFTEAMNQSFFDQRFVLLVEQGLRRHSFEANVGRYVLIVRESLSKHLSKMLQVIKFFVFLYLVLLMAMYYAVLYMPMQIMEVL